MNDSIKRYFEIMIEQDNLKLHYDKRFNNYKNVLCYNLYNDDVTQYSAAFKLSSIQEIQRLLFEKLNNEYCYRYTELEKEKSRLLAIITNINSKKLRPINFNFKFYLIYILFFCIFIVLRFVNICNSIGFLICIFVCNSAIIFRSSYKSFDYYRCESVAPVDQCNFFRDLTMVLDFGLNNFIYKPNNSLVLSNIYINIQYYIIDCSSSIVGYKLKLFLRWIELNDVEFISMYGIIFTESEFISFLFETGYSDYFHCILNQLLKKGIVFRIPFRCNKQSDKVKYVMVPYAINNWIVEYKFCI